MVPLMTGDTRESYGSGTIGLSRHEDLYVPSEHGPDDHVTNLRCR